MTKRRGLAGVVGSSRRNSKKQDLAVRRAAVEALEGRVLLAVTAGEYDTIRSGYPGFGLPADMASINIIEITPEQLSVANLKSAITTAGGTILPDLVVLRTTDTQNTITYASSTDALSIDTPSAQGATSIVGFGSKPLTIDAANQSRVIAVGNALSTTIVNLGGMTLTRGYSSGIGGGVYQFYGILNLTDVTINGSRAGNGGGMYVDSGILNLTNVTISENTASIYSYGNGGGVYQDHGASTLTNVTIRGNTASANRGGGMYQYYGTSTLTNVTINWNTASFGGGVFENYGVSALTNVTISGNTASGNGGGVYQSYGTSTLTNVAISGNTVPQYGGGVYQDHGTSTLTNVTISGNTGSLYGGGVYLVYGTSTVRNTIVARNAAGTGPDVYVTGSGAVLSGSNNLIGDGGGQTSLVNGSNGNLVGSSASPIDPKLAEGSGFGPVFLHCPAVRRSMRGVTA